MTPSKNPARVGSWIWLLVLAVGCTIHRLPTPVVPPCKGSSVSEFWKCVDREPVPTQSESGFVSSIRAASVLRKSSDQDEGRACRGITPPGYELKNGIEMPSGRAPLHALWSEPAPLAPIVIVVHGLYDSKFSKYVRVTSDFLRAEGFGVLAPDMRWHGCLLSPAWLPTLGLEEGRDLVTWANWLRKEHPGHPIGLIGFSLGGLSVLHAAGESDAAEVFDAGTVAISPAGALARTADDLDSPAFFYDRGLTFVLRTAFRGYLRHRTRRLGVSPASGSFWSFLDWLVQNGPFPPGTSRDDLLRMADPVPAATLTKRPVLVLASRNDPIISLEAAADLSRASAGNPYLHVVETPFGGHIGQIGLFPEWTAKALITFFRYGPPVLPRE
jgi:predicted alpha/beta-fold hydrolase